MTADLERVARAVCQSRKFECGQGCCAPICMESLGEARRNCPHVLRIHGDLARAAVAALREPSEDVLEAVHHRLAGDGDFTDLWRTAIDAILKGE